jgi:hypothetical protein
LLFDDVPVLLGSNEEGNFKILIIYYRVCKLKVLQMWDVVDVVM